MDLQALNDHFGIPGVLEFNTDTHGLTRASITSPACTAEVYLHGAHVTAWQPAQQQPVLFLSETSPFAAGKAIRGGVPVIFPWFGARTANSVSDRTDGPSHGFARTSEWQVAFAAMAGDNLHLTLTLEPNEASRALGYDDFKLAFELTFGRELKMRLTVANLDEAPLYFEEALHTYLHVGDATRVTLHGLAGTEFIDKTDSFKRKTQQEDTLSLYRRLEPLVHIECKDGRHDAGELAPHDLHRNRERRRERHPARPRHGPLHGSPHYGWEALDACPLRASSLLPPRRAAVNS
jgi:glucose-6-phosphate 1-epimerase